MIEILAVVSGVVSGACLMAIAFRKKLPWIGTIASRKLREPIDATDRRLALTSLVFFVLCIIFLVIMLGSPG
jgi:hypothetical protein